MTEHRWSKFWWQDYESDDALRLCSLAAQGLWMRMLCAMHRGDPHGHLAVNGSEPTPRQLSIMLCATEREIAKLVPELEAAGVLSRSATGIIYSRRLVRDKAIRDQAIADGKRGGNPTLKRGRKAGGLTPPDNATLGATLKQEAEAEAEAERTPLAGGSARTRGRGGSPLPDGWQPAERAPPPLDHAAVLARFTDWHRAHGSTSADWGAKWRLWLSDEAKRPKPPLHTQPPAEQDRRILAAVGLQFDDPQPPALRIAR